MVFAARLNVFFPLLHRFGQHTWLKCQSCVHHFRCLIFSFHTSRYKYNSIKCSDKISISAPYLVPCVTRLSFLNSSWKVAATLVEVFPHTTKENRPQHVANPNTSMQGATVGLAGMHDPKLLTVHTESREVRHRHKNTGEERVKDYVHSLNPLWMWCQALGS